MIFLYSTHFFQSNFGKMNTRARTILHHFIATEEIQNENNDQSTDIDQADTASTDTNTAETGSNDSDSIDTAPAAKRRRLSISKEPRLLDGKYFKIIKRDGSKVDAVCTECGKTRKGEITSTGNFMEHFRKSHPNLVDEVQLYRKQNDPIDTDVVHKKSQKTISEMFKPFTYDDVRIFLNILLFRNIFQLKFNRIIFSSA